MVYYILYCCVLGVLWFTIYYTVAFQDVWWFTIYYTVVF